MSNSVWKHSASGRTVRRKKSKSPPFVMLPKYMIQSAAWCWLSGTAMAGYVELGRRYDGTNNGKLHLSARELGALRHCSQDTAARGLRELVAKGFVDVVKSSGFNIKDRTAQAAEYRLTLYHCNVTRQPPSKAFTKWRPEPPLKNISRSDPSNRTVPTGRTETPKKGLHDTAHRTVNPHFENFTVRPVVHF